jgi:hypothetical protein
MGYHSSPSLGFIMTLLNVRLGAWLGNPGPDGKATFNRSHPRPSLRPMFDEALGKTNDKNPYVYLSDSGHFENLGLYEMVRRRCRQIVLVDAGQDASFAFEDLGNAVRRIYIDMGVRITFDQMIAIFPHGAKDDEKKGRYGALGTIHYEDVDSSCEGEPAPKGHLMYVKPAFYGEEPIDVYNYAKSSTTFTHETTANQFFTESQFESYRALGSYVVERVCSPHERGQPPAAMTLDDFFASALKYIRERAASAASRTVSSGPPDQSVEGAR